MNDDLQDFKEFMKQREAASEAYVQGDAEPLSRILARTTAAATFFGPNGGSTQGTAEYPRGTKMMQKTLKSAVILTLRYCKWQQATA